MLQMHHLPSVLNLFTDRLSRGRPYDDYVPGICGMAERWWAGES